MRVVGAITPYGALPFSTRVLPSSTRMACLLPGREATKYTDNQYNSGHSFFSCMSTKMQLMSPPPWSSMPTVPRTRFFFLSPGIGRYTGSVSEYPTKLSSGTTQPGKPCCMIVMFLTYRGHRCVVRLPPTPRSEYPSLP